MTLLSHNYADGDRVSAGEGVCDNEVFGHDFGELATRVDMTVT